jgi:hypothetical protein
LFFTRRGACAKLRLSSRKNADPAKTHAEPETSA